MSLQKKNREAAMSDSDEERSRKITGSFPSSGNLKNTFFVNINI
jgi:hypothetical protein